MAKQRRPPIRKPIPPGKLKAFTPPPAKQRYRPEPAWATEHRLPLLTTNQENLAMLIREAERRSELLDLLDNPEVEAIEHLTDARERVRVMIAIAFDRVDSEILNLPQSEHAGLPAEVRRLLAQWLALWFENAPEPQAIYCWLGLQQDFSHHDHVEDAVIDFCCAGREAGLLKLTDGGEPDLDLPMLEDVPAVVGRAIGRSRSGLGHWAPE